MIEPAIVSMARSSFVVMPRMLRFMRRRAWRVNIAAMAYTSPAEAGVGLGERIRARNHAQSHEQVDHQVGDALLQVLVVGDGLAVRAQRLIGGARELDWRSFS